MLIGAVCLAMEPESSGPTGVGADHNPKPGPPPVQTPSKGKSKGLEGSGGGAHPASTGVHGASTGTGTGTGTGGGGGDVGGPPRQQNDGMREFTTLAVMFAGSVAFLGAPKLTSALISAGFCHRLVRRCRGSAHGLKLSPYW